MSNQNVTVEKKSKNFKLVVLIAAVLLFLVGAVFVLGGVILVAFNLGTDSEGFAYSNVYEVRSSTYAFALWVAPAHVPSYLSWLSTETIMETRWVVSAVDSSKPLFVGWTKEANGQVYLNGIGFQTPPSWHWSLTPYSPSIEIPTSPVYGSSAPSRSPGSESFWLATETSDTKVQLNWTPVWDESTGRNILVIMNADGSSNVDADVQLAFKVPIFGWLPYVLLALGLVMLLGGWFLVRYRKRV
ncbi:MAG: hypothetical protein WC325_01045 [Candidatus Bathyarchaeia archaeon]